MGEVAEVPENGAEAEKENEGREVDVKSPRSDAVPSAVWSASEGEGNKVAQPSSPERKEAIEAEQPSSPERKEAVEAAAPEAEEEEEAGNADARSSKPHKKKERR